MHEEQNAMPPPKSSKQKLQEDAIALIEKIEAQREETKKLQEELTGILEVLPLGELFQDEKSKIVYRAAEAKGQWVTFYRIAYERTKKEGEKAGSVSMFDAKAAGFTL